ncbi:MAG: GNAT family N-acetyltransferase [Bacteroidetes bacterium]|nr:GNAT family N-acetyltransferase [Bacteroidota bacterium]
MIKIAHAGVDDAAVIVAITRATWEPTYDPILPVGQSRYMLELLFEERKIREQIATGSQNYLLLYDGDKAVGFAAYAVRPENSDVYKLHKLYCIPALQGKGYGKALITAVEQEVLKAGKSILELNVNRNNKAIQFYKRMGYAVAYDEDIAIGPYWMNDHVMRKVLI